MNSLRPLVTITILAVVGAWLYVKINQGPGQPAPEEPEAWSDQTADGVPPLVTTIAPPVTTSPTPTPTAPPSTVSAALPPAPATAGNAGVPQVPEIPELPDMQSPAESAPSATAADYSVPAGLPASIPAARYPGDAATQEPIAVAENASDTAAESVPIDTTAADVASAVPGDMPQTATHSPADHEASLATDNAMAAAGFTSPTPSVNSVGGEVNQSPADDPASAADRYGLAAAIPAQQTPASAATPPVEPTFAEAWPEIQAALDSGDLARAHQLLTAWYGDESLTPTESQRLDALLGQLAGTVVYSTEHRLEPPYVVKPGDTLDSIARHCDVPWQLLAKINGVPSVDAIQPGQQLKVLRGPFSAVVDLRRSQLTLMLDGRYAGKFPIVVPDGTILNVGQWVVGDKLATPSASASQLAYASPSAAVDRVIVLRGEDAAGKTAGGPTLAIISSPPGIGAASNPPAIRIAPQDAEELSDILSIGSRVIVRR